VHLQWKINEHVLARESFIDKQECVTVLDTQPMPKPLPTHEIMEQDFVVYLQVTFA